VAVCNVPDTAHGYVVSGLHNSQLAGSAGRPRLPLQQPGQPVARPAQLPLTAAASARDLGKQEASAGGSVLQECFTQHMLLLGLLTRHACTHCHAHNTLNPAAPAGKNGATAWWCFPHHHHGLDGCSCQCNTHMRRFVPACSIAEQKGCTCMQQLCCAGAASESCCQAVCACSARVGLGQGRAWQHLANTHTLRCWLLAACRMHASPPIPKPPATRKPGLYHPAAVLQVVRYPGVAAMCCPCTTSSAPGRLRHVLVHGLDLPQGTAGCRSSRVQQQQQGSPSAAAAAAAATRGLPGEEVTYDM
jgi:hypothetical protein